MPQTKHSVKYKNKKLVEYINPQNTNKRNLQQKTLQLNKNVNKYCQKYHNQPVTTIRHIYQPAKIMTKLT